ncbi:hypothetical protein Leryth_010482 [Lithospermum erythrorhizon]|nr:hypothetical protein Leryth_010482 [Lithospermum erythrorhizon]
MEDIQLYTNWDDIVCPICLDFPHNCVLLQCSSHDKGCRPFVCDTDHLHSNCLDRFKQAHGVLSGSQLVPSNDVNTVESMNHTGSEANDKPLCPLCRGGVTGWIILENVRVYLDEKKRQLDWENFQQSSEIIDVLSTIHAEVPRGVVLGDYVIEYGDDNSDDDFGNFPRDEGNWWTSCIFRTSRNRRRSRVSDARRGNRQLSYDASISDEGSVTSLEFADYRADETDDELINASGLSQSRAGQRSLVRKQTYGLRRNGEEGFTNN